MAGRQRSIVGIAIAMAALWLWLGWRKFPDSSGLSSDTEAPGVDETRRYEGLLGTTSNVHLVEAPRELSPNGQY